PGDGRVAVDPSVARTAPRRAWRSGGGCGRRARRGRCGVRRVGAWGARAHPVLGRCGGSVRRGSVAVRARRRRARGATASVHVIRSRAAAMSCGALVLAAGGCREVAGTKTPEFLVSPATLAFTARAGCQAPPLPFLTTRDSYQVPVHWTS